MRAARSKTQVGTASVVGAPGIHGSHHPKKRSESRHRTSPAECETVTLGVWIDAGSRYEAASNNGAAHFLEHIAFKGRRTDAAPARSGHRGHGRAPERVYVAGADGLLCEIVSEGRRRGHGDPRDILQNSLLDSGAVDRERDVILREMEEVNKQHEELILDLLRRVCGCVEINELGSHQAALTQRRVASTPSVVDNVASMAWGA